MATVRELLDGAVARLRESGSESARLDAELLLGFALDTDRTAVIAHTDAPVGDGAGARFAALLDRRAAGEPVAYIRGVKEFHGLAFGVDPRALIPRPETELLVQLAELELVRRLVAAPRARDAAKLRVIDVGTGSGTIAVTLAVLLRRRGMGDDVALTATDSSDEALQLARENAVAHAVGDRIEFETADLLPGIGATPWDLVLANLPYVRSDAVPKLPVATSFEPVAALDGGPDGLRVIARLLDQLPTGLAGDGAALIEIGGDQGDEILALVAERLPGWSCEVERDFGGLPRVAVVRRVALGAPA
ncbi:MAG TPA: peptide chain release factor N(5)-glutamine methyltransferase [Candidatus Limnocylindrales bacterium]|nr:peptide chain release factor N(5)-glutamine methyltransferase [Candidatus Limnocylindrales bacterium]